MRLRALLVDVGGVLIDDRTLPTWDRALLHGRLAEAFGEEYPWFGSVAALQVPDTLPPDWRQPTYDVLTDILTQHDVALANAQLGRICRALAPPWPGIVPLEPGAAAAMLDARALGLKLAICSNTAVRSTEDYERDMPAYGMEGCFDAYVTSLDVGFAKPNPAMFEVALAALGVAPEEAAMIGDRPDRDILGARRLGIRTIWKRPSGYAGECTPFPDAQIDSLHELTPLLRSWLDGASTQ